MAQDNQAMLVLDLESFGEGILDIYQTSCRFLRNGDIIQDTRFEAGNDSMKMPLTFTTVAYPPYVALFKMSSSEEGTDENARYILCGPIVQLLEAFVNYAEQPVQFIQPKETVA